MRFDVNEWRKIYDEVQLLGLTLKDSLPSFENGIKMSAKTYISHEAQEHIRNHIRNLTKRCSKYLDACGIAIFVRKKKPRN